MVRIVFGEVVYLSSQQSARPPYPRRASPIGCRASLPVSDWSCSQLHSLPMCAACEQLNAVFLPASAFPPLAFAHSPRHYGNF